MSVKKPAALIVCDGWGEKTDSHGNAIANAKTPNFDRLKSEWPHTTVAASGEAVGLPAGQIGNSEVGHLTIGSGRIKLQPLSRQIHEIQSGSFFDNVVLKDAVQSAVENDSTLHILGLLSDGGVHSYDGTAFALVKMAKSAGLDRVAIHAITDGRDVAPQSALEYIKDAEARLSDIGVGKIVSVAGRYYAMDRDNRWERIAAAYDMLTSPSHDFTPNLIDYIQTSYGQDITDEFIKPMSIASLPEDRVYIKDGDVVVFFNFRPDRARQLSHALIDSDFSHFNRKNTPDIHLTTIAEYDSELTAPIAFPEANMPNTLAETVSKAGLKQLHIAETEKYAHVTYFMNGGREESFEGEDRQMIASPKVATYDLAPAMSAGELTEASIKAVQSGDYDLIIMNYANADMVGHTGVYDKTVEAIEALDACLGRLIDTTLRQGGVALMTADHGNAETMVDNSGQPITAHSTSLVPVLLCGLTKVDLQQNGGLRDIAPTILDILGLKMPPEMTGQSLITK